MEQFDFFEAKPVWAEDKEKEMNYSLLLRAELPACRGTRLRIAGHSDYQIFVNGEFVAQGPARAGHGFFRADEIELTPYLTGKRDLLCILCAGYNVNSFALTDQPPFVCAEVILDGKVLFATGSDVPFDGFAYTARVQKVQRFSFQRPFTESYVFDKEYDRIFKDPDFCPAPVALASAGEKKFITRDTLRSDYERRDAKCVCFAGRMVPAPEPRRVFRDRSLNGISETLKGFPEVDLEVSVVNELYAYSSVYYDFASTFRHKETFSNEPFSLPTDGFAIYDMGLDTTGYIRLSVEPEADTTVFAVFNEHLRGDGTLDPGADSTACVVRWQLRGGRRYELLSFEPYTYRYIQIISVGGACVIDQVAQLCEHFPAAGLAEKCAMPDEELQKIYDAAVETFRQNATDIFMDCPSRERAGWLCDSFFTSRTEYALTGKSRVEKAFLENFIMEDSFACLPEGMLPMCYPSDHYDGVYIPNWAMWYLLELAEYRERSGDGELIARAKDKMYALAAFLGRFENESGLLESLESWVFVEWSEANEFTQDVNFPTNMLYAKFLDAIGILYGDAALREKAERLRRTIREIAFDGAFFLDNAERVGGELRVTGNHTETAQYYAFFTGVATPETYPQLYGLLKTRFGPDRDPEKEFPDVPVSNAFIGNYLRLDILYQNGEYDLLLREIRKFFLPMAEKTGTLWENMTDCASCCHGFASCVAYWLKKMI
ncbi:MAG: hypothetical protein IJL26_12805 [Clostridia bacterium]|nr:hypothetical protein [Clostridia bacterium]